VRQKEAPLAGLAAWKAMKAGDWLGLRDDEAFLEGGVDGVDYRIGSVSRISLRDRDSDRPIAEYLVATVEASDGIDRSLVLVSSGEEFELRLYFAPPAFARATRDGLIDRGNTWFFLPPADPEDFISADLEYAPWPDFPAFDDGSGKDPGRRKLVYGPFGFGQALYGSCERDGETFPLLMVEYATEEEARNPLILLLEERWMRPNGEVPPEGGFVTLLSGRALVAGEAELIPA
jgi:hypothetical protein